MIVEVPKRIFWLCPKPPVNAGGSQRRLHYKLLSEELWPHGGGDSDENWVQQRSHLTGVPKGFLAVYVGPELRRFVIPTSYLSTPEFRNLMDEIGEKFGYQHEGGIRIPCEEQEFEQILLKCTEHDEMSKKRRSYRQRNKFYSF